MARQADHRRSVGSSHNPQPFTESADFALVQAYRRGSRAALDALMLRYHQFVRLKASSYFLAGGDAEDLIQEGMLGLYKAVRDYRDDRQASFRSFAELCITRQIITAIKTATRQKHAPLNGYLSLQPVARRLRPTRATARWRTCCPAPRTHDPVNQVISSEELDSLIGCLTRMLVRLEGRVLRLYLEGLSYERIANELGLRHQDRRQRSAAHQAQGRPAPGEPQVLS